MEARKTPFHWDDPEFRATPTPAKTRLMNEMAESGSRNGFSIPIPGAQEPVPSIHLVPGAAAPDPANFAIAHCMAMFAYDAARRIIDEGSGAPTARLTRREREYLLLAARGKSDWAIGEMLGVSERTVHHAIERAKTRFDAGSRVLAIVRAIKAGEFGVGDIID